MRSIYKPALALFFVTILLLAIVPRESTAFPYKIEGYLKDTDNVPIPLANISFTGSVYDYGIQDYKDATLYTLTDSNGYFVLYIGASEPGGFDSNSEVTVAYSANDRVASKVVTIQGMGTWANLTYDKPTDMFDFFTTPIGLASIVVIISAAFFAFYVYRSSHAEKPEDDAPKRPERRRRKR